MPLPPEPIIRGASRWLSLIPTGGVQRARALLASAREYADLTPTQYAEALEWVKQSGLLEAAPAHATPASILEALIIAGDPNWLQDADALIHDETELPDDVLAAADALGISETTALTSVRRAWGKVDLALRKEIGDRGELEIIRLLSDHPSLAFDHVASWSDPHGYDIAVKGGPHHFHLEVKATTRRNRMSFFLSRNEYETMRRDPSWLLVMVQLNAERQLTQVLTIDSQWIEECSPMDRGSARWESARFEAPAESGHLGIPALEPWLSDTASPLRSGVG